ncbi:hypothetical protein [Palleronia aestuarii]|uniref:hypothetical protein n=1 Tax=Palleronia aestuarii TaxID=568105 RepID=UPI0011B6BAC4|nr:hypothetical protein [Palleronia aestuarii]
MHDATNFDPLAQLDWAAENAELRKHGSLTVWFDPKMPWDAALSCRGSGQHVCSDDMIHAYLLSSYCR